MVETSDGFEIARRDLEIRGPGEFLGARQSGAAHAALCRLSGRYRVAALGARISPLHARRLHPELADRHVQSLVGWKIRFLEGLTP
jgi:ATP-dependent DNA helicase RecG